MSTLPEKRTVENLDRAKNILRALVHYGDVNRAQEKVPGLDMIQLGEAANEGLMALEELERQGRIVGPGEEKKEEVKKPAVATAAKPSAPAATKAAASPKASIGTRDSRSGTR